MTKKLKRLEHEVYAHDGKTFEDIGHIKVIYAQDLPRCGSCEFCVLKAFEVPSLGGTEKWTDGYYCTNHDRDVETEDFCAWWEERQ